MNMNYVPYTQIIRTASDNLAQRRVLNGLYATGIEPDSLMTSTSLFSVFSFSLYDGWRSELIEASSCICLITQRKSVNDNMYYTRCVPLSPCPLECSGLVVFCRLASVHTTRGSHLPALPLLHFSECCCWISPISTSNS